MKSSRCYLPLLAACFAWLSGVSLAFPQERQKEPLQIDVNQANWALRTGAPMPLRLNVTCSSPGIIEGDLEIQVSDGTGAVIAQVNIPDLVYSPGRQEIEYLLPIQSHSVWGALGITCFFREKGGALYTSTGQLILPTRRSFVVPIVRGASQTESADDFTWLLLETWSPKHSTRSEFAPMLTQTLRIRGADLPRDALKHLAHDIVVVEAEGFAELVAPQIRALDEWVAGGGSLFLQIGQADLSTEQQAFVDRLTAKQPDVLDDEVEGTTLIPIIRGGVAIPIEHGLGQVWLTTERSWSQATDPDRIAALGFLWRLKQTHRDSLAQAKTLSLQPANSQQQALYSRVFPPGYNINDFQSSVESDSILGSWEQILLQSRSTRPGEMIEALMPRDVQAVPVWLLSAMILVYIVAIGFGDYLILGKLKRRRWTWFTFPAMSLLVSLLSIGTAQGYLGTSQELSAVEFRDVHSDGTICRVQRFELLFHSSSGETVTQLNNAAFTPVSRQTIHSQNRYQQYQQYSTRSSEEALDTQVVMIEGNPTLQASVTQRVEQWKPQLNRMVSFSRGQKAPLTLPTPGPEVNLSSWEFQQKLTATIAGALPQAEGWVLFSPQGGILGSRFPNNTSEAGRIQQLMTTCQAQSAQPGQSGPGLWTLFDQISPNAGTGLEDMVIATPGHAVLCVVVREANNELVIYRWRIPSR